MIHVKVLTTQLTLMGMVFVMVVTYFQMIQQKLLIPMEMDMVIMVMFFQMIVQNGLILTVMV